MKKTEFQSLVDQTLSGLEWDQRQRQKVLHAVREEENPVKKFSTSVVLIALVICISFTALAAGLMFSPRYDAVKLANSAMEETYGLTADLLSLFHRTVKIHVDGTATVIYAAPRSDFPWEQMGDYFVEVSGSQAHAFWSNDGIDISGGLDAKAWGKEQLHLLSHDYSGTMQHLWKQKSLSGSAPSSAIQEHVWTDADETMAQRALDEAQLVEEKRLAEISKAEQIGTITIQMASVLARQAVCQEYGLTDAQRSKLLDEPDSTYITYENDQPMAHLLFWLWQNGDGTFTEKDGQYWVTIDMTTSVIEDILYDAALAGNG